jgi:hypothetical protein
MVNGLWTFLPILGCLIAGLVVMTWGRQLPRRGDWLSALGLLGLVAGVIATWHSLVSGALGDGTWVRGWILPRRELPSILVGIVCDPKGMTLTLSAAVLSAVLLINRNLYFDESRPDRLFAAAAIGASGVAISWLSLTPWLACGGLAIVALGGFISLGTHWSSEPEARVAARFAHERIWGLLMMFVGCCALATAGTHLVFSAPESWTSGLGTTVGAGLLVAGLLVQMHPFPFLSWGVMSTKSFSPARVLFACVFPGWAALAVLIRLQGPLKDTGILPVFGWFGLVSAFLAVFTGLTNREFKNSVSAWLSAAQTASVAALVFSGPAQATAIMVVSGVVATAIAILDKAIEERGATTVVGKQRAIWAKVGLFVAALAGSGMVGFVSCGASLHWVVDSSSDTSVLVTTVLVLFLITLLLWKLVWSVYNDAKDSAVSWTAVVSPLLLLVGLLGVFWTGTLTGGALPDFPDRVTGSLLNSLFGANETRADTHVFASWFHWGAFVLAAITAFWTSGRKQTVWERMHVAFPATAEFFAAGYKIDRVAESSERGMIWLGKRTFVLFDQKIWREWVPKGLQVSVAAISKHTAAVDSKLTDILRRALGRSIDFPARSIQFIQNGDVQWYLLFAVGCGIAMLIHFLRF